MTQVREHYWVPRLRRLVRKVIKSCNGCYRFRVKAYTTPPPAKLPVDCTEGSEAFEVLGVDFAGPLKYGKSKKQEGKAYLIVYACSLTCALHLKVLTTMETMEFLGSLGRRGCPKKIYSDNGGTFVAAAKCLRTVMKDKRVSNFLARGEIKWQFNLSQAPWWGGQFERMICLIKQTLYKTIGNGFLWLEELKEVILDIEMTLNNRPLSYVEDEYRLPYPNPKFPFIWSFQHCTELETH